MTRISHKKRQEMTYHMMEHLKGNKQHLPREHDPHVDRAVAGAGIIGQRISHNTPTAHHGRQTVPTKEDKQHKNEAVAYGEHGHAIRFDDETSDFMHALARDHAAWAKKQREEGY